jgi:hypothetical protein
MSVLTITLDWSDDPDGHDEPTILFLMIPSDGEPREVARIPAREAGLPLDFDAARESPLSPIEYELPTETIFTIHAAIQQESRREEPLWLELDPPESVLALASWEYVLRAPFLRRRPVHPFLPLVRRGPLSIALCYHAGADLQPWRFDVLRDRLDPKYAKHLHIFLIGSGDRDDVPQGFKEMLQARLRARVDLHRSWQVDLDALALKGESGVRPRNPWLRWMSDVLGRHAVDFFQFVCDGAIGAGEGLLALDRPSGAGPVGAVVPPVAAQELDLFLTQVGAWSAGFEPMGEKDSVTGLTLLAERLARRRPGPIVAAYRSGDPRTSTAENMRNWLAYLAGEIGPKELLPWNYGVVHGVPDEPAPWFERPEGERKLLQELTLAGSRAMGRLLSGKAERWLQATQRMLEQLTAAWLALDDRSPAATERRRGLEQAARVVIDSVNRHLGEDQPQGAGVKPTEPAAFPRRPLKSAGAGM